LAGLAKARGLLLLHDIGSGLLSKSPDATLRHEPDVQRSLADGADLVMFSCDKLLGGPQAGVLAGRARLIATLASQPMLRALRLDKVTIALLRATVLQHLRADDGFAAGALGDLLRRSPEQRRAMAEQLADLLKAHGIACTVITSRGCHGGGSIPGRDIESFAVRIDHTGGGTSVDTLTRTLRQASTPIVAVPREGRICLDVLAMFDDDLQPTADIVVEALCYT
jgi:L-seryl-tRNA(Ser) seleniumtransferase